MDPGSEEGARRKGPGLKVHWIFLALCTLMFAAALIGTVAEMGSMQAGMGPASLFSWSAAGSFLVSWLSMMAAMMLPSLVPALLRYRDSILENGTFQLRDQTILAMASYFFVWELAGLPAFLLVRIASAAEMRWMFPNLLAGLAVGVTFLLAGLYQFTRVKASQLTCCREVRASSKSPSPTRLDAWRYGLHLGRHCVVCCLGFMAALLVSGMTSLMAMTAAAAVITIERLVPKPVPALRIIGMSLLLAGMLVVARSMSLS